MFLTFRKLKNLIEGNKRDIVNFLTFGDRWDVSILFYGASKEVLKLIKKFFGKSFSFLLKNEIICRLNYITLLHSKDVVEPKLIIFFEKKTEFLDEEQKNLIKLFCIYGNYDENYMSSFLKKGKSLPPLIISRMAELEAEISLVEKLCVLGTIKSLKLLFPESSSNDNLSKRISIIYFDDEKSWPEDLNPIEYQIHVLNTVNDFTVNHFFANINIVSNVLSNFFGIDKYLMNKMLLRNSFFSLIEKREIEKNSRILSEKSIDIFPNQFNSITDKYNLYNFTETASLFLNINEFTDFLNQYSEILIQKFGVKLYVELCKINFNKFRCFLDTSSKIVNLKQEYRYILNTILKVKEISDRLNSLSENPEEADENFLGKILLLLEEIENIEKQNNFHNIEIIQEIKIKIEKELSNEKNILNSLLSANFKIFEDDIDFKEELSKILRDLNNKLIHSPKLTEFSLKLLDLVFHKEPLLNNEKSKKLLELLEINLLKKNKDNKNQEKTSELTYNGSIHPGTQK